MVDEGNDMSDYTFLASSLLLICFLSQKLLSLLKKKTGLQIKTYHNKYSVCIIIICILFHVYFFMIHKIEIYKSLILQSLFAAVVKVIIDQWDYSKAHINKCLKDSESIGAYWAHQAYDAYYKIVLEDIKDRMSSFEKENNIQLSSKKLMLVIPLSCDTQGTFTEKDDSVTHFGTLQPIENDAGANINRNFKNPVYKISSVQDVYIVAEFSGPMSTLWKSRFDMAKIKRDYIRDCYIKTLKLLVQGSPCTVVIYDDIGGTSETLSSCLLSTIEKENKFIV